MAFILVFGTGFALAQTGAQNPPSTPPTFPSQQQPTTQHPDESTGQASASTTDLAKAQADIQTALRKQLPASADSVTVSSSEDGKIRLLGTVTSETEKNQIEQIAQSAAPNVKIENKLTVATSPSGPTAMPPNPTVNPENKTGTEKPNPPDQSRKPMPPMGSSFMAQNSAPQNPPPPSGAQSGTTNPGTPDTTAATSTDAQSSIQKALQQDPSLANANITVTVNDNKVELTGTVANKEQKKTAKEIAESKAGGMKVIDHLKVEHASKESKDTSAPPKKY